VVDIYLWLIFIYILFYLFYFILFYFILFYFILKLYSLGGCSHIVLNIKWCMCYVFLNGIFLFLFLFLFLYLIVNTMCEQPPGNISNSTNDFSLVCYFQAVAPT